MTFVHADSQEEHSRFEIAPGRLIMWNNSRLMHKVDAGNNADFRVMLGPMSLDPASDGSGVVQVGNLDGTGSKLKNRTISVVPRSITSLNVFVPDNPDQAANYKIGLEWSIPIDAETTGGMSLSGFTLRYADLSSCGN